MRHRDPRARSTNERPVLERVCEARRMRSATGPLLSMLALAACDSAVAHIDAGFDAGIDAAVCSTCTTVFDRPVLVDSRPAGTVQREPSIGIDSAGVVWVAYIEYPVAGEAAHVRFTRSIDEGRSFEPSREACSRCGDPVIRIDAEDRVFLSVIVLSSPRAVAITRIDDRADNPREFVQANAPTDPHADREWVALGPAGEIFVTWNAGIGAESALFVAKSVDHGRTFGAPVRVAQPAPGETIVYGAIAVGDDGAVNIIFPSGVVNAGGTDIVTGRLTFVRSTDGGASFLPSVELPTRMRQDLSGEVGGLRTVLMGFPSIEAASDGTILVTWSQQRADSPDGVDIVTARSADGRVFSPPVRVNDDVQPTVHTLPWTSLDTDGLLHVFWLDAREHTGGARPQWAIYYASSRDSGRSFTPNQRLSMQGFSGDPNGRDTLAIGHIGEFNAIASGGGRVHAVWSGADIASADVDVFLASGRIVP